MLYVFQVDNGSMMTFDMNLALESVSNLKDAIWQCYRIPLDRQVLLVSGGECLDSGSRVCNYAAGTDTNPIFLFNKANFESSPTTSGQNQAPSPSGSDNLIDVVDSIKDQVEGCLALPSTYMTVVTRSQLAQQLWEMAKDITRRCEELIHDQHLQHQGWAAVVANLEDLITAFKQRTEQFEHSYKNYLDDKTERSNVISSFEKDLATLESIPVIPNLLNGYNFDSEQEINSSSTVSLKQWIVTQDSGNNLENLLESCCRGLDKLDGKVLDSLQREANIVIEKAGHASMKEIKGLEERLFGLDQLLLEARKLVHEQYDLAQAFLQNQNRASDLRDPSILPDLCNSHQHQLKVMQRNHQQLEDIRRRCAKAKEELSVNLIARLKWVTFIQRSITDCSNKVNVYQESLRRLKVHMDIISQIHSSAPLYCEAVSEVTRRKKFSEAYSQFTKTIAERMEKIHSSELQHRSNFSMKFEGHFLNLLFPGLDDNPKPFATQPPKQFDLDLPQVSLDDVEDLKKIFPTTTFEDDATDFSIEFPLTRSNESSTSLSAENSNLKGEIEILRSQFQEKKDEVESLNKKYLLATEVLKSEIDETKKGFEKLLSESEFNFKQAKSKIEELTLLISKHEETLKDLSSQESTLKVEFEKERENLEEKGSIAERKFEEEKTALIEKFTLEKESEIKALKDQFKQEIEGLRSRYKLMASMDQRSMSESNEKSQELEKSQQSLGVDNLIHELLRVIDALRVSGNPEALGSQMIRGVLGKIESNSPKMQSPASIRARLNSESERFRTSNSIESEDDTMGNMRSVYGLDTSAIDASALCNENFQGNSAGNSIDSKDLELMLIPPEKVVFVATKYAQLNKISTQTCKVGDNVFVHWNDKLKAYLVYLSSNKNVHFIHTDCLKSLNPPESTVQAFLANVTDKEFCVARRAQNRYRVPQGFHFYRIRVKVVENLDLDRLMKSLL